MITTINKFKQSLIKEGCMSYWPGQHYDDSVADYMGSELMPKINAVSDPNEKNKVANEELLDCIRQCYIDYEGDTNFWNNHFILITIIATMQHGIKLCDEVWDVLLNRLNFNITYVDQDAFMTDEEKKEYSTIMHYVRERLNDVKDGYAPGFLDENDKGRIEIEKQFGKVAPTDQPLGAMQSRDLNENMSSEFIDIFKLERYATAILILCDGEYGDTYYNPKLNKVWVCIGDSNPFNWENRYEDLKLTMSDAIVFDKYRYAYENKLVDIEVEAEAIPGSEFDGWFRWTGKEWIVYDNND